VRRRMMMRACASFRSIADDDSWDKEKERAAAKEKAIKELIYEVSNQKLSLRRIGVGVEGELVTEAEKKIARKILDYLIWDVEQGKLVALADVVSTRYDFKGSKFFPVAFWKVEVMRANVVHTVLIYELEKESANLKDKIWWYIGRDIAGEKIENMPTKHRGQIIRQDVVATDPALWTQGVENLIKNFKN